jgi:membrane associated rhomboid family serine protease
MVAQAPDRRAGKQAGAVGIALLLVGLTLLLEPPSWRPAAAALLAVGLAGGVVAAMRLRPSGRLRTPMERLNDAAFLVVISAVALIAVRLARPWTAALPGLVGGALLGLTLRPRAGGGPAPRPEPGSGRAEPPPPGARPPGGGA